MRWNFVVLTACLMELPDGATAQDVPLLRDFSRGGRARAATG